MAYGMDTVAVNPVAVSAALAGTTITVKLGGLGPGGVTLKENKLGFEALGTDGLWHSTPVTGKAADSVTVGPAPAGAKAVRYLWYSSPCSPYKGQPHGERVASPTDTERASELCRFPATYAEFTTHDSARLFSETER